MRVDSVLIVVVSKVGPSLVGISVTLVVGNFVDVEVVRFVVG